MDKTSLGFQKPKEEEYYDINIFNQNAQLANDLIEKNSSAIGQKLDKNSSFYADLEAYYGNTKLVDDFQDISKWVQGLGTLSIDTANVKIGENSLKLIENDNISNYLHTTLNDINLDLTKLNNNEESTEDDYIYIVIYISDVSKIDPNGIRIFFSQTTPFDGTNTKYKVFNTGLVTGWNFLKAKKSEFGISGAGKWDSIKSINIRWYSTTNAQNAYVSFQLIQLVKADPDTLLDRPNPFQKFGVRELIVDELGAGEEYCLYKQDGKISISVLNPIPSLFSIKIPKVSGEEQTISTLVESMNTFFGYLSFIKDTDNRITLYCNNNVLLLTGKLNGVSIGKTFEFAISSNSAILTLEKKSNKYIGTVVCGDKSASIISDEIDLGDVYPYIGFGTNGLKYLSFTEAEISHAHHSDTSELAKSLEYRDLKIPCLLMDRYKIKTFVKATPIDTTQKEIEIDLGDKYFSGTLEITLSSGYNVGNAMGSIRKIIDFIGTTSVVRQDSRYIHISYNTKDFFSISDIYVKDGRKYIKIIQNSGSKNFFGITLEAFGEFQDFEKATIGEYKPNSDTFVEPSIRPIGTTITSGFVSGWSGSIIHYTNQEQQKVLRLSLVKDSDIIPTTQIIYTLPLELRPAYSVTEFINLFSTGASPISNSFANISIGSDGVISVLPVPSTNLVNARRLLYVEFIYY